MIPTQPNHLPAESLSALVDGELAVPIDLNDLDASIDAEWNAYQTIGEVIRAPRSDASVAIYGADPAFLQRLTQRLDKEKIQPPLALAPGRVTKHQAAAANDATFRWKLVAGLASFGAVAAVGWSLVGAPVAAPEQLARTAPATELVVASPQGLMVRDARLEELLSAHKQLGGTSLQAPSGFLRHAGFESTNRDKR
jgi:sigma-E factor negative regulatory protein RseA